MASKPLSYESLKCVLQHMDPNTRFQMSNRCPSIRTADKSTMLRVSTLAFENGQVTVNGTIYRIGIICKKLFGETPESMKSENQKGGCRYDVDEHGSRTRFSEILPGDVNIGVRGDQERPKDDPNELALSLRERKGQGRLDWYDEKDFLRFMSVIKRCKRDEDDKDRPVEELPSYKTTIQLTVISGDKVHIEHYQHNKNYIEAVKQLGNFLFGGRENTDYVRNLRVAANLIIRLPIGTKFQVDSLHVSTVSNDVGTSLSALRSIVHKESLPLKRLHVGKLDSTGIDDPTLKEAEILVIDRFPEGTDILSCLENKRVHIPFGDICGMDMPLKVLIKNWIKKKQEKATFYTFTYFEKMTCQSTLQDIAKLSENTSYNHRGTIIPITSSISIVINIAREIDFQSQKMEWMLSVRTLGPDE